jgi:hypothetical protein
MNYLDWHLLSIFFSCGHLVSLIFCNIKIDRSLRKLAILNTNFVGPRSVNITIQLHVKPDCDCFDRKMILDKFILGFRQKGHFWKWCSWRKFKDELSCFPKKPRVHPMQPKNHFKQRKSPRCWRRSRTKSLLGNEVLMESFCRHFTNYWDGVQMLPTRSVT